jgi:hypothetical protein
MPELLDTPVELARRQDAELSGRVQRVRRLLRGPRDIGGNGAEARESEFVAHVYGYPKA